MEGRERLRTRLPGPPDGAGPETGRTARIEATGTGSWAVTCYRGGERVEARFFAACPAGPSPLSRARAFARCWGRVDAA